MPVEVSQSYWWEASGAASTERTSVCVVRGGGPSDPFSFAAIATHSSSCRSNDRSYLLKEPLRKARLKERVLKT